MYQERTKLGRQSGPKFLGKLWLTNPYGGRQGHNAKRCQSAIWLFVLPLLQQQDRCLYFLIGLTKPFAITAIKDRSDRVFDLPDSAGGGPK